MQILHPFSGSISKYSEEIADPDRRRPDHCPQCEAQTPLRAHGFYRRTLVERGFDGLIQVRRYLCLVGKRTISLLPEFALPYLRFGISVISLFLVARLLMGQTLQASAVAAGQPHMSYQRGQFWVRRFRHQAEALCLGLAALISTPPAVSFLSRALQMLESLGWTRSHRFLFSQLRVHLLGWPRFLAPRGCRTTLASASPPSASTTHSICLAPRPLPA